MIVLVTGSRNHDPAFVRDRILAWVGAHWDGASRLTIIHGDAAGADQGAHLATKHLTECAEVRVPARWSMGRSAGPRRNEEMLDYRPDVVLAFPLGESRGTRHCMGEADARGIRVVTIQ